LLDAPLKQVALSGGEPLLRSDLPEIVYEIKKMGLGVVVITNGTLLDRSRLECFPEGCTFEVTLFSADASLHDRIAGRVVFKKLIKNLSKIDSHGHGFVLATIITRLNARDVTRTIKLGIALGAQAVLFNRINLSRRVFLRGKHLVPYVSQLRSSLREADEISAKYGIQIAVSVPIPPCIADPGEYPHLHFGWCPRGGINAYYTIGNNGYLRPCNHSSVVLGDLRTQGFAEMVTGQKALDFWASTPLECKECEHPLKEKCLGGCPAAADECYGTADRRDPFVELATCQA
jgi:pyrroloquinoline quinone biosynthesis protein E